MVEAGRGYSYEILSTQEGTFVGLIHRGGKFWNHINFLGRDRSEVVGRVKSFIEARKELFDPTIAAIREASRKPVETVPAPKATSPAPAAAKVPGKGRGVANANSKWMKNEKTGERVRVQESEVSKYASQGWTFGKKLIGYAR